MPAFMAGMGGPGRTGAGMPRRPQEFNQQQPGANQFTQALNTAAGTPPATGGTTPAPAQGPGSQPTPAANPYAQTNTANPWTMNPATGQYQPNSGAYMPEWMQKKPEPVAPPAAPMKKERQVKDYTARADTETGTTQQALAFLQNESAKRGKALDIPGLTAKYGGKVQNNMLTGSTFNDIMKDVFGEDVDVPDTAAQPATPGIGPIATPAPIPGLPPPVPRPPGETPIQMGPGFPGGGPIQKFPDRGVGGGGVSMPVPPREGMPYEIPMPGVMPGMGGRGNVGIYGGIGGPKLNPATGQYDVPGGGRDFAQTQGPESFPAGHEARAQYDKNMAERAQDPNKYAQLMQQMSGMRDLLGGMKGMG